MSKLLANRLAMALLVVLIGGARAWAQAPAVPSPSDPSAHSPAPVAPAGPADPVGVTAPAVSDAERPKPPTAGPLPAPAAPPAVGPAPAVDPGSSPTVKPKSSHVAAIVAGILGAGIYVATIVADSRAGGKIDFPEVFLPVLGPVIAAFRYDDVVVNREYARQHGDSEKLGFAASGILQAACLAIIIVDLTSAGEASSSSTSQPSPNKVQIAPFGGPGAFGLSLAAALP